MSAVVFHPADDDDVVAYTLPSYAEDEAPPNPWDADAEAAERELNAPPAPWEDDAQPLCTPGVSPIQGQAPGRALVPPASLPGKRCPAGPPGVQGGILPIPPMSLPGQAEPGYLPVAETPPARPRPLKRPPPTLGRVAPMPAVARTRTAGQWVTRYSALTTASDPAYVLQVGINVLLELRQEQRRAAPVGGLERLASARLLKPLWGHPALREDTAGVLAVLEQEIEGLIEALEVLPIVQRGVGWELLEAARGRAISTQWERLAEVVGVLRKQMRRRGAARKLAETLAGLAWKALVTLSA